MGVQTEIVIPRYVVLTKLADSWIPRASVEDVDSAEAEAFRWRRIYGPGRTRVAEYLATEPVRRNLPAVIDMPTITVSAEPVNNGFSMPQRRYAPSAGTWQAQAITLHDAALRGLALYLGFGFANRAMELLIILAQH